MIGARAGGALALAVGVLVATAAPAAAETQYAHPTGKVSGTCTAASDACSLGHAVTASAAGDEIVLLRGTTPYELPSGLNVSERTLRGEPGPRPLIQGGAILLYGSPAHPATIGHLELRGGLHLSGGASGVGLVLRGAGLTVNGSGVLRESLVVVAGANAAAVTIFSGSAELTSVTAIATGSDSEGLRVEGEAYLPPFASECTEASATLVARNVIARGDGHDVAARPRTVDGCSTSGLLTIIRSNFRTQRAENGGAILNGGGNQTTAALTDDAAIFADTDLYRQKASAPTVDAGEADAPGAVDLDAHPRVQGAAIDIGSDELPDAPRPVTGTADSITTTSARLVGTVVPGPVAVTAVFDHGPTTAYGATTPPVRIPAGSSPVEVSAVVDGLAAATAYRFRLRAVSDGPQPLTAAGADTGFTTAAPSTSPPQRVEPLSALTVPGSVRRAVLLRRGLRVEFHLGVADSSYDLRLRARLRRRGAVANVTLARLRRSDAGGKQVVQLKPRRSLRRQLARLRSLRMTAALTVTAPGHAPVRRSATVRMRR